MALQQESNRQLIQQRLNLFRLPVLLIFLILGARLWQLQIIQGSEYGIRAERNRIRTIQLVAPRGAIADRNNVPLVENRPSFNVVLYREYMKSQEDTVRFVIEKLGVTREDVETRLRRGKGTAQYQPIVLKEDAGIGDISVLEAHRLDHPEVELSPEPRRKYPFGKTAAHLLGYVGEISEKELESNAFPGVMSGTQIGQSGIEKTYNKILIGKDGARKVLVNSLGQEVGRLEEADSVVGGEIHLTLDLDLQSVAEKALEDKVGAIVAMDPRNGEILAMASAPSFDPNDFSTRMSEEKWAELLNHPDRPMQNRAIQNSYSPGSIFKLIMADAGLEEGLFEDNPTVTCTGSVSYYGRIYHCAQKGGHGTLHLEQAIAKSCNIFFYDLGRKLGITKIAEHAQALGLGAPTGIDLPGERAGIMPSPEWKKKVRKSKWFAGETISVAIGQGAVSATPLQMLRAVSAIATDGVLTTPHVLLRAEGPGANDLQWAVHRLPIGAEHASRIRQGMWESVNNFGTGHNAAIPGMDVCGKTGTVQVISNERKQQSSEEFEDHSWFAGFASKDNPQIAVVVFLEHGGKGGIAAAPLARQIFSAFFDKKNNKPQAAELSGARPGGGSQRSSVPSQRSVAYIGEQSVALARRADDGISGIFRGSRTPPASSRTGEISNGLLRRDTRHD
ncbi:MAG TPA: penicillin-binding protein 2 [Acidobacteriota bacterium]|nr:penicillin-binding protein 2 [Acidobacteriota bacterium]